MALIHFGPLRSTSGPLRSTSGPLRLRGRAQARWTGPEWTGSGPRPGPLRSSAGPHLVRSTCSSLRSTAAVALVQGSGGCKTERGQPRALSLGHPHRPHSSLSLHHLGEVRFICSESRNKTQQKPGRPVCRGPHTPSRYFAPRRPHAVRRERELSARRGGGAPRHASMCPSTAYAAVRHTSHSRPRCLRLDAGDVPHEVDPAPFEMGRESGFKLRLGAPDYN